MIAEAGEEPPLIDQEVGDWTDAGRDLCQDAYNFAYNAHKDQKRKYTGGLYIDHCVAVVNILWELPAVPPTMIAAAYLHDTVEDTDVTLDQIRDKFGDEVANLVYWLTDVSRPLDGNRAVRKALDRAHIALAPPDAQTIKLADIIDNTSSILENDPEFAKVYLPEKRLLLDVMKGGAPELWIWADRLVREGFEKLDLQLA